MSTELALLSILAAVTAAADRRPVGADPVSDPARGRRARARGDPRGSPRSSSTRTSSCWSSCRRCSTRPPSSPRCASCGATCAPISMLADRPGAGDDGRASPSSPTRRSASAGPEAFVLGAIVSPTDPVAATAIARRLGVPGRIVTIVEGESLVNDATALVAYKFAVAAVVTGSFSLLDASGEFVVTARAASRSGSRSAPSIAAIRRRLDNPPVEVTIALFSAYFAYLPAEAIGVSGRARRGHRRHLHGPADLAADDADDADPGRRRLGDRHLPAQLGAVRARRPAAADRRSTGSRRPRRRRAGPRRRC